MRLLSSLTNRIFLACAALTVVCTGIAIAVVNVLVTSAAEEELRRGLIQAGAIVEQQRTTRSDLLIALARLIADLPRLKAAVDTNDPPTVQPVAEEYERQVDVDLLIVTDKGGRVLASVKGDAPGAPVPDLPTIREALAGRDSGTFWVHPDGLLQVVSVPITVGMPPEILGTLTVGFVLDDGLAEDLKSLTGSDIAFAGGGQVRAATLPPSQRPELSAALRHDGVATLSVGGVEYLTLRHPLSPQGTRTLLDGRARLQVAASADASDPAVLILRSPAGRLGFLRTIQAALGLTAIAAVLLATLISYGVARTISRPLEAITATMKEIARTGDLTRRIDWSPGRWDDEDARLLVRTFNTLTESVAAAQREASERERLSALGRLSTVVAHEVRNPLMIIRAALRSLARESAPPAVVREAATDIEEEVRRLDRVVNDVLDFARPIRFELRPADVNKVCEDAAEASVRGTGRPAPRLALDPSIQPIVTDAERLRLVLVNLLVNARQAVEARFAREMAAPAEAARSGSGGTGPRARMDETYVDLRTAAIGGGRVEIIVEDHGIGMTAGDAAKAFDAYYTTKPSGTGLGLAIARNVVEGLGGKIEIQSEQGAGTKVRIELGSSAVDEVSRGSDIRRPT